MQAPVPMNGPNGHLLRERPPAVALPTPFPPKLDILCVLPGGREHRLVSINLRGGGLGLGLLARLRARLSAFVPRGAPFALWYEAPHLPSRAAPLERDQDVARMVAASHGRLGAVQARCPRVLICLLAAGSRYGSGSGPGSPTAVLNGGSVLGNLHSGKLKRCFHPSQSMGEKITSAGSPGSNKRQVHREASPAPCVKPLKREIGSEASNSHADVRRRSGGGNAKAVVKMSMARPLSSLIEQVSLEARKETSHSHTKDSDTGNKSDVINDVSSKEAAEAACNITAVYTQLASQNLQTIENTDLEELQELGRGRYGTVLYGKWKGSDVAIKRLRSSCFSDAGDVGLEKMVTDFWKEALLLGKLRHPNVVAFYGVVSDGPVTNLALVTEYMVNGSLKQVLKRKDRTIDRRKRLIIAMDAAFGMEYLHEKNVVHFDIKSHNLFVNIKDPQRPICKIGDLGLSKVKQRTLVSGGIRGTVPWMAPELFHTGNNMVTEKVDVYSFGIVMWELLTGEEPYENMKTGEILAGILKGDLRPEIPSWCGPEWRSLMERCWSSDPRLRPPFSEIAKELRNIAASANIK